MVAYRCDYIIPGLENLPQSDAGRMAVAWYCCRAAYHGICKKIADQVVSGILYIFHAKLAWDA
jgi:hypothetical protein